VITYTKSNTKMEINIKASFEITSLMDMEFTIRNLIDMMGYGEMVNLMEEELLIMQMEEYNLEYIDQDLNDLVLAKINIQMDNHMLVVFITRKRMELELIIFLIINTIKENGKMIYNMEKESSI
jgi:hypothetical protein